MPEGPEIRLAADKIAAVLVGQEIEEVRFGLPKLRQFERTLTGHIVTDVCTRGKAMLTRFDNGLHIYSHNQLYGRWYTVRRPRWPKTNRQLRIELTTKTHRALLYSASDIAVLDDEQLLQHPFLSAIGPDILGPRTNEDAIVGRLNAAEFRNRALGHLYLDQRFLAGLGNYLRSEILWAASIAPGNKPSSLQRSDLQKLAMETLRISRRSYRNRGVTVVPSLAKSLKAQGMTYRKYRFYVFGRHGLPCYRCGTSIERQTMGSRNIFLCPGCQVA